MRSAIILIVIISIFSIFYIAKNVALNNDLIFISVPSYRDSYCKKTLNTMFKHAKYPQNIRVGIYEQNSENQEERCDIHNKYKNQIRYLKSDYRDAKGPLYARARINQHLYNNERYVLMIDSHSYFLKNWDVEMIKQLNYLNKRVKKPILSSYPNSVKFDGDKIVKDKITNKTTALCEIIKSRGYPTVQKAIFKDEGYFYKSNQIGGGLIFTYGQFFRDIDLKPKYPYIFGGEEMFLSALAYTHGWDVYSFAKNYVYHFYYHDNPSWNKEIVEVSNSIKQEKQRSHLKLLSILKTDKNYYPMGNKRSLNDFWKTIKFDYTKHTLEDQAPIDKQKTRCANLKKIRYHTF